MLPSLANYLESRNLDGLLTIIDNMECQVSICQGRKFRIKDEAILENFEDMVTFDQLVHLVYQRTKLLGNYDGADIVRRLNDLDIKGEEELKKSPIAYVVTLIKRFFLSFFSKRAQELNEIALLKPYVPPASTAPTLRDYSYSFAAMPLSRRERRMYGAHLIPTEEEVKVHKVDKYLKSHRDVILKEINRLGWKGGSQEDIGCFVSEYGTHISIKCPQESFCYINAEHLFSVFVAQGHPYPEEHKRDLYTTPSLKFDINLTPEAYLERLLDIMRQTLPFWLKFRSAMQQLWKEDKFKTSILTSEAWQTKLQRIQEMDFKLEYIYTKADFTIQNEVPVFNLRWDIEFTFTKWYRPTERDHETLIFVLDSADQDASKFWDVWQTNLNKKLEPFLLEQLGFVNKKRSGIFGGGFFGGEDANQKEPIAISKELTTLETMLELAIGTLTNLVDDKNFDELEKKLKEAKRKGGLKFHPDKPGGSEALFQPFDAALKKAEEWCKEEKSHS